MVALDCLVLCYRLSSKTASVPIEVLQMDPLQLGKNIQEVPVWGLDSYTRRMIEIALKDRVDATRRNESSVRRFIEKKLLPAINAESPDHDHNINCAIDAIIEVLYIIILSSS
jgi:hypothetical protein